ncbi:MAG: right-handed parallel beta-helix repeat-containing protein [Candidatus Heimdallarchaeota archaeon]|nr:right-handed parallel beta-helix repeat-containing protein [Candidatus Heimdallarchaeota archaeon]
MKKKGAIIVLIFVGMIFYTSFCFDLSFSNQNISEHEMGLHESNHPYIQIYQNSDFQMKYSFPGNGSEVDPYIIEDLVIEAVGYSGIYISYTDVHFIIRNCTILSTNYGIALEWLEGLNSLIYNNTFWTYQTDGVFLYQTSNLTFYQNTVQYCSRGFYLSSSLDITIAENTFVENDNYGVEINTFSHNNAIAGNSFLGNNQGGSSQGFDDGENNLWYNPSTFNGNSWSDYGSGDYQIDGSSSSSDIYPLDVDYSPTGKPDFPLTDDDDPIVDPKSEKKVGEILLQILVSGIYPTILLVFIGFIIYRRRKANLEFWTNVALLKLPLEPKGIGKKTKNPQDFQTISEDQKVKYFEEMRKRGLI